MAEANTLANIAAVYKDMPDNGYCVPEAEVKSYMLNEQESTKRTKIRDAMYGQFMADRDKRKRDKRRGKKRSRIATTQTSAKSAGHLVAILGETKCVWMALESPARSITKLPRKFSREKMRIGSPMLLRKALNSTNNKPTSEDLIEHDDDDLSEELSEDLSEDDEGFDAYD